MGSGTCILEAIALRREGIGFDIDPLAVMLSKVKVNSIDPDRVRSVGLNIADHATLNAHLPSLGQELAERFDAKTKAFVDYWFSQQTQLELLALIREIEKIKEPDIKEFLLLVFSAIIITKSGGVSLAWDLAHTRPHKTKQGVGKSYKPAAKEFIKRLLKNLEGLREMPASRAKAFVHFGNAEALPLKSDSVDLLFTSPPYASNAIDYMRAHKFSLVWFSRRIDELSDLRSTYIGGEKVSDYEFLEMPAETRKIIGKVAKASAKKGLVLHRYYSEMRKVFAEALRVLKPGRAAFFVVGSSTMHGIDSRTQDCLGEIGSSLGFELIGIGTRRLDRDRRMMPARLHNHNRSLIEERMHEEHVIAMLKPEKGVRGNGRRLRDISDLPFDLAI